MVLMAMFGLLVVLAAACLCLLLVWSWPGKPKPFVDQDGQPLPGSLSEKVRVDINGLEQGMFLKAKDKTRPVLLYLHGGLPEYVLTQRYPTGLESEFVVCWWEQRGSGLSYRPGMSPESVTVEQLVADTLARCRAEQRTALVRKLEASPITLEAGVPPSYLRVRDEVMHALGVGTMREMRSVFTGVFLTSLRHRDYTLAEKVSLWRGKAAMGVSSMWKDMLATDLAEHVPAVSVPVYFLHGVHDYTCTYDEASTYFARLTAPLKGFYTFDESAHSPVFEEPDKVMAILREDVLHGTIRLADRKPCERTPSGIDVTCPDRA